MKGIVIWYSTEKNQGVLEDENGDSRYFQYEDTKGSWKPLAKRLVEFNLKETGRGLMAVKLKPLGPINNKTETDILNEISGWKLDSKLEDINRYYYPMIDLSLLESGNKSYVIGRKGTGKTAISEYIIKNNKYARKLTFKNFPFNELYSLYNNKFTPPNQYITLWKYVIYSSIAEMLCDNEQIENKTRILLKKIYSKDIEITLSRKISSWTSSNFSLQILGTGFEIGRTKENMNNLSDWLERVEILEDLIRDKIDDSSYMIIFDELDEDYKDNYKLSNNNQQYIALLTSLFKAIQDIKSIFPPSGRYKIFPIAILRDDIYNLIKDSDKNKWSDFIVELDWPSESLRQLISHRISKAFSSDTSVLTFFDAWYSIFESTLIQLPKGKNITFFEYITVRTQLRPRDYIKYLSACSSEAVKANCQKITPDIIRKVERAFSNYLREELENEMLGIIPNIAQIMDLLSIMGQRTFKLEEFTKIYYEQLKTEDKRDPEEIIRLLFHFNVIGNQTKKETRIFQYKNRESRINLSEYLCIHPGLYHALQLFSRNT